MASLTYTLPTAAIQVSATAPVGGGGQPQWKLVLSDGAATPNTLTIVSLSASKDDLVRFAREILQAVT